MLVATWNVNSIRARIEHVTDWLETTRPDILALQETKVVDEDFPRAEIEAAGYSVHLSGQKTYNGVAALCREPASVLARDIPGLDDPQRRVIVTQHDGVTLHNLYVPNGSSVGSDKYDYKLNWLDHLLAHLDAGAQAKDTLVVGDFNIAPADIDVHDPAKWEGSVLVSDAERKRYQQLRDTGLVDVFRAVNPDAPGFSWWDYRAASYRRKAGMRIDLIFASTGLAERCVRCWVDEEPRRRERPSDHAPVVAEFAD